jgi:hypothetical protein
MSSNLINLKLELQGLNRLGRNKLNGRNLEAGRGRHRRVI